MLLIVMGVGCGGCGGGRGFLRSGGGGGGGGGGAALEDASSPPSPLCPSRSLDRSMRTGPLGNLNTASNHFFVDTETGETCR